MFSTLTTEIEKSFLKEKLENINSSVIILWLCSIIIFNYRFGLDEMVKKYLAFSNAIQFTLLLVLIVLISVSGELINRLTPLAFKMLCGRWPGIILKQLSVSIKKKNEKITKAFEKKYEMLYGKKSLNLAERNELMKLEDEVNFMPYEGITYFGNIIHHITLRQKKWYGLDVAVCWPRLWLLLPEHVKKDISMNKSSIDQKIGTIVCYVLLMFWGVFIPWLTPLLVVISIVTYRFLINDLKQHYYLVCSCFDLYRFLLYDAIKLPANSEQEEAKGRNVTSYLHRGE